MKTFRCAITGLISAIVYLQAAARAEAPSWTINPERLGLCQQAGKLIGFGVQDQKGKKVGTISDFLLDLQQGQVVVTLVAGKDAARVTLMPATTYRVTIGKRVQIDADREQFSTAPQILKAQATGLQQSQVSLTYKHFHCAEPQRGPTVPLVSAVALIGAKLSGTAGETLGQVKELLVDLQRGQIVYLVVNPAPDEHASPCLYLVPPVALNSTPKRGPTLALSRAEFLAGPRFQNEFWADLISPRLAADVCAYYHLAGSLSAPTDGKSDQQLTQAIMTELAEQSRGSARLTIVVTAIGGRVTLSGSVKDEDQRRMVIGAAERIVGAGNVEDHLEPRRKGPVAQL